MKELLLREAENAGIALDGTALSRFEAYYRMIAEKNRVMNLVGNAEEETVAVRHFLDSLMLIPAGVAEDTRLIDIGAGAGFPGLPLKIALPGLKLTLLDATRKKTDFLAEAVKGLGLTDVEVLTGRAEKLIEDGLRGKFAAACARAVAAMPVLLELSLPFLREGGRFYAPKSGRLREELAGSRALEALNAKRLPDFPYSLPGGEEFLVFRCEVVGKVPEAYPRRYSKIKQEPL